MTPKGSGAPPPYWLSQLLLSHQVPQVIGGFQFSDISETLPPAPASFLVGWAMLRESGSHWVFFETWTPVQASLTPEVNSVDPASIPSHFS